MPLFCASSQFVLNHFVARKRVLCLLAKALGQGIIEAIMVKLSEQGRAWKMAKMYEYLTSTHFRVRVSAIVEACVGMQEGSRRRKTCCGEAVG